MNSGTKSRVHFILSGDQDQTHIRTLSVLKCLGPLNYLRIWHDNSGENSSASWFLKYIIVRDLQTMGKSYFIARHWFAVEKDDGLIERTLLVASEVEINEFSYILSKKTYHSISDGHLRFSIFSRPPSTRFTRTQRCTCRFVLLFISMLLNIMYYDLLAEAKASNQNETISLAIGPLYITPQQIGIGAMVELFAFLILSSNSFSSTNLENNKEKISIDISIFFIMVRGIEFDDLKTQKWLTSILSGIFSSILCTQPIKIICLAIIFALFCQKSQDRKEENEYIDETTFELDAYSETQPIFVSRSEKQINRLTKSEIEFEKYSNVVIYQRISRLFRSFYLNLFNYI